jgi:hypothetical protein
MRIRTGLGVMVCCCAGLAACTAAASKGPDATVTTPAVGRPPAPASAQAALSSEAFTPYAGLGLSNNDGLAPGESSTAFAGACMTAEGYPGPDAAAQAGSSNLGQDAGLVAASYDGGWGYITAADAQQYGFLDFMAAVTALGLYGGPVPNSSSLPQAEQAAANKCTTIEQDFFGSLDSGPLAGIGTLSNDIATDVQHDPAVQDATRAWSACMTRNGYSFSQPQVAGRKELQTVYGTKAVQLPSPLSAAGQQAQLAAAVTDADCTESSDLAGIYFAVQASYEQQIVTANQQALATAVTEYRAAYARELSKLPALLHITKAQPFPPVKQR